MQTLTRSRLSALALVLGLALVGAACSEDTEGGAAGEESVPADEGLGEAPAEDAEVAAEGGEAIVGAEAFAADLSPTGDAVVPGPGADGIGEVTVTLRGELACIEGEVEGIGQVVAGYIYEGDAGTAGDAVADLGVVLDEGPVSGCDMIDAAVVERIVANPGEYYVQLHTEEFPDGAVRAQLG